MTVYIAGPISNDPDYEYKFNAAHVDLLEQGHTPANPLVIGKVLKYKLKREPTWAEYMRACIKALMECDGILMLDGWQESKGARIEQSIASSLGMERITLEGSNNGNEESL